MKNFEIILTATLIILNSHLFAQESIKINQIGFYRTGPKFAVSVETTSEKFFLLSENKIDTVYVGLLGPSHIWSHSGETVKLADFSEFKVPGSYYLSIPNVGISHKFKIDDYIHQDISRGLLKSYYLIRASMELTEEYAGKWARPMGHHDKSVRIHASAADENRPVNSIIYSSKGWYDAGDYNKYIVNSGISTFTILAAYEHFPQYYKELKLNIPEKNNQIPDILDEALWNIRWMLTMQDPHDGGVYHKLTLANFSGVVMPHQASGTRYVVQKSTQATLNFAAVMAQAGRIFQDYSDELPGLSDSCLTSAKAAWNWAVKNNNVPYDQNEINRLYNPDINTGTYSSGGFTDEFQWAAAELFITTKDDSFLTVHNPAAGSFGIPWWGGVNTLGLYSMALYRKDIGSVIDTAFVVSTLISLADRLKHVANTTAYHVPMGQFNGDFTWGSNGIAANQAMLLMQAFEITNDSTYLATAVQNLDYLLGRNAVGYCFVTGFGQKSTMNPHHRPSEADGIVEPVPGLLAGGPNPAKQDGCPNYLGSARANSYVDNWCSYASNETCINWNAPAVYVTGAIEASYSINGKPLPVSAKKIGKIEIPVGFELEQNFPNPFNSSTIIQYSIPSLADVTLNIYNLFGQKVASLLDEPHFTGNYQQSWNGRLENGGIASSGIYFYKLDAYLTNDVKLTDVKEMVLIK